MVDDGDDDGNDGYDGDDDGNNGGDDADDDYDNDDDVYGISGNSFVIFNRRHDVFNIVVEGIFERRYGVYVIL